MSKSQRTAGRAVRPGHALRDHHFDRALSNVDDTEHRHIRQANQHLAHASSVDNHRSPPADDENTASMAGPCAASADPNLVATPRRPNRENLIGQIRGWKHILNTLTIHYGDRIAAYNQLMTITTTYTKSRVCEAVWSDDGACQQQSRVVQRRNLLS